MQARGGDPNPAPKHRRTRIPLSCDPCRTRKLKCNRERPCQNCAARNEQAACKFRSGRNGSSSGAIRDGTGDATRQRIDHLEDLVKRLIGERQQTTSSHHGNSIRTPESPIRESGTVPSTEASDTQDAAEDVKTIIDGNHSVYRGGDDWYVVLQEINELKKSWNQEQDDQADYNFRSAPSYTADGSSLLFNQVKPIERMEILSALPSKPKTDLLIRYFFSGENFPVSVPPIVHEPTFMREYEEHWRDPCKTNPIWLGLLFSILGITMLAYHQCGEPPDYEGISESLLNLYRMRTAQCLLSGDIAKCLPYTVEALRFNATAELNRKDDNRRGLWIMTGVIVRTAVSMGYHRDPSKLPGISALHAEYRRRIWVSVIGMDDMASFISGFPRAMSGLYSDTKDPLNVFDWELSEDTNVLPPARPFTERTPATYLIVKRRLFRELGRVSDFGSAPSLGSYETLLEIDQALSKAYEDFPPQMKLDPDGLQANPAPATMSNLSLVVMYHRGLCLLHRKFMAKGSFDNRYKLSHDRCVSSALALLAFQENLGANLYKITQTRQMLTLAAMILILELELRRKMPDVEFSPGSDYLLQVLDKSSSRWTEVASGFDEAWRDYHILMRMLSSLGIGSGVGEGLGTGVSQMVLAEPPLAVPEASPKLDAFNGGFSFETNFPNMDFDWASWDAFIEEPMFDSGHVY